MIEPYVDMKALGRTLGVSRSTIKRWVQEGMPSETWGLKRTRRFQPSRCIDWLHEEERRIVETSRDRAHNASWNPETEE